MSPRSTANPESPSFPSRAQVVIAGGGVIGCSVAYHLAQLGLTDVLLLEQAELSAGTSWHAAGLVGAIRSSVTMTGFAKASRELYRRFESEADFKPGFKQCGGLWLARKPERLVHLRHAAAVARSAGVDAFPVSPAQARELWPLLNQESVLGGLWVPDEGKANPVDLTQALARRAAAAGVMIRQGVRVTGIVQAGNAVTGVRTSLGDVECDWLVNAAGQWAPVLGAMAGVDVPLYPVENMYVVSERHSSIGPDIPNVRDPDAYAYYKEEVGGLVIGGLEPGNSRVWVNPEDIPDPFSFSLLPERWDEMLPTLSAAAQVAPVLDGLGIRKFYNGPESYTPDHNFLMGEPLRPRGLFVVAGMNGSGIGLAGGVGKAAAEWIVSGEPQFDSLGIDIGRFAAGQANSAWLKNRIHHNVFVHFEIPWPERQEETGRGMRRSPLHDQLVTASASFEEILGWERPKHFSSAAKSSDRAWQTWGSPVWQDSVDKETEALLTGAGVYDDSSTAKLMLTGRDAEAFLTDVCATEVALKSNGRTLAWMLSGDARLEANVHVIRIDDETYLLLVPTRIAQRTQRRLTWLAESRSVSVVDVTSAYALLQLIGPRSAKVLEQAHGRPLASLPEASTWDRFDVGLARATVIRQDDEATHWGLLIPAETAPLALDALAGGGSALAQLCGSRAVTARQLILGQGTMGLDFGPRDTPAEIGLTADAFKSSSAEYIGKAALERQYRGMPARRLVRCSFPRSSEWPWRGQPIYREDIAVGGLTSSAIDPSTGNHVGLCWIQHPDGQPVSGAWLESAQWSLDLGVARLSLTVTTPMA